jgi:aminoglycoside phosphotransferase (APT) family kinase protein
VKSGSRASDRPTRRAEPERGYGWLAAVVPADARRFRVSDPALAAVLTDAGADLVGQSPDVEIAPVQELRGDAAVSIALLGRPGRDGRPLPVRVVRRLANSGRVRLEGRRARRRVARLGHPTVTVLTWDHQRTLRDPSARRARLPSDLAEYFPQRALVVGRARRHESSLDAVLREASKAAGRALHANSVMVRSGLLIIDTNEGMLRVAIGAGSRQIRSQRASLAALAAASECPSVIADRIPWLIATGRSGLTEWSLERRLPGMKARPPVRGRLLAECLDFLTALHPACPSAPRRGGFGEQAEVVASACAPGEARVVRALAERLETVLADVHRGFGHGDFFHGNLLVEGGRLVGVADWDSAGPGRLPLIDLLHLRHTSTRELADIDWGPALLRDLLPWAREGGDDALRTYCRRIGFTIDGERLEALAMAYWLEYVSYRLQTHDHQLWEPLWPERNISLVLDAIGSLPWIA